MDLQVLKRICWYVVLASTGTEQITLLETTAADKKLEQLPQYKELLQTFITKEVHSRSSAYHLHFLFPPQQPKRSRNGVYFFPPLLQLAIWQLAEAGRFETTGRMHGDETGLVCRLSGGRHWRRSLHRRLQLSQRSLLASRAQPENQTSGTGAPVTSFSPKVVPRISIQYLPTSEFFDRTLRPVVSAQALQPHVRVYRYLCAQH